MSDEKFFRRLRFFKQTMEKMVEILREAYAEKHKRRGRHSKLDVAEIIFYENASDEKMRLIFLQIFPAQFDNYVS